MRASNQTPGPEIQILMRLLEEAYLRKAWHGPNLRGAIRGLTADSALKRPAPGRHNIWEIVVHAAYWKYAVRRRLLGEKRGTFALKGSNWFRCPDTLTEDSWKVAVSLLDKEHLLLREAILKIPPAALYTASFGGKTDNLTLICGIASHDLYHAGQIQLIKRLVR
ncbi:MAG TPA: DinB family protein [Desulfomonilaceae bacterium]|nr:DinB family protein [Desulfomonilaceae bacterium]HVN82744.1 DinB family protein [Terriglobia bacterium]